MEDRQKTGHRTHHTVLSLNPFPLHAHLMLVLPGSSYFCPGAWHLTQITVFGHNSCIYVNELIIIKFKVQLDNNIAAWNLRITIPITARPTGEACPVLILTLDTGRPQCRPAGFCDDGQQLNQGLRSCCGKTYLQLVTLATCGLVHSPQCVGGPQNSWERTGKSCLWSRPFSR